MSDDKVHHLGASAATEDSERRAAFIAHVARAFDHYVEGSNGEEPDAIIFWLGGIRQRSTSSWTINAESRGCASALLALCGAHMTEAAVTPNGAEG